MKDGARLSEARAYGVLDTSLAAWLALALGLGLSIALWAYVGTHLDEKAHDRFAHRASLAKDSLLSRLQAYKQVLHGGVALFAASDEVSRAEWSAYVAALHLDLSLPGIQGTGFTRMLPAAALAAHVERVRSEGFPDYQVSPPGERDPYSSIVYLEPFDARNRRAFGFDMYAEPVRREAMQRARDSGQAALSGKVTLVQEDGEDVQAGFLIYLPVYEKGMPAATLEERRAALIGFVYSPFRAQSMIHAIFGDGLRDLGIELYDDRIAPETQLYASSAVQAGARHVIVHPVEAGGRRWVVRFSSTPRFEADNASAEASLVLYGGTALSLMLFATLHSNARHRRQMRAAAVDLTRSRDEFRTLVENVPGVVFRCRADPPWQVVHISQDIQALTGAAPADFICGRATFADFIVPEDVTAIITAIDDARAHGTSYEVEYRMRNPEGSLHWVSERGSLSSSEDGSAHWLDGVIIDITERKAAEDAIRNLAFTDPLTRLPNRRFLLDRLRQGLANSRRHGHHGALLFIDLDHFKDVNDIYGHEAGDTLLCEIAERLRACVREGDTVARLGGDEFVVMLEELGDSVEQAHAKATVIASNVLATLNEPCQLGEACHHSTPSIGVACFDGSDERAEDLLRRADAAMYRAKSAGRNRLETATS
ncbi:GGDEF domain-containing protein [Thauera sp.]|jgi:diguanylate cyclase (GGDEF)-like protein/PAS domain S-box-containing protein|uniref:GGDEF domain-containing protein n=1 Tax=Thauera sp. TaxID=1905334 RepID=UPI00262114AE|nr:GGDEF domain-containing protein [Thauera sp.]